MTAARRGKCAGLFGLYRAAKQGCFVKNHGDRLQTGLIFDIL